MEKVTKLKSEFVDFNGNTRKFMLVAVSRNTDMDDIPGRIVTIGASFCSEKDNWNDELGYTIAYGRAIKHHDHGAYFTHAGMVTEQLVSYMLDREAECIKSNPGSYIKGYNEAAAKHMYRLECAAKAEELANSLTEDEKKAMEAINNVSAESLLKIATINGLAEA